MGEYTDYILERALDSACKELTGGNALEANRCKSRLLAAAHEAETSPALKPVDHSALAPSYKPGEEKRIPGSSPPASN